MDTQEDSRMDTIPFLVVLPDDDAENNEMGIFGIFRSDAKIGLQQVPVDLLKKNLAIVSKSVIRVLEDIESVGRFKLKERTSIILQLAFCEGLYLIIFDLNVPYVGFPSKLRPIFAVLPSNLNTFLNFSTANAKPPFCWQDRGDYINYNQ